MISGTHVHYYVVCRRKLWLFAKGIRMEQESDRVLEGHVLHQRAYGYLENKEVLIDNQFVIDAFDGEHIREVKMTSRMAEADRWQVLFYLWQLKLRGIIKKGLISYPKERRTEEVILTVESESRLEKILEGINHVINLKTPPPSQKLRYCSSCAYYFFCFAKEVDE